jgi:hypothetical protein
MKNKVNKVRYMRATNATEVVLSAQNKVIIRLNRQENKPYFHLIFPKETTSVENKTYTNLTLLSYFKMKNKVNKVDYMHAIYATEVVLSAQNKVIIKLKQPYFHLIFPKETTSVENKTYTNLTLLPYFKNSKLYNIGEYQSLNH